MGNGFSLSDEQLKAFEEILSKKNIFSTHLTTQEAKYGAFKSLSGHEKVLSDIKTKIPLGFNNQAIIECDSSNLMDVFVASVKFSIQSGFTPVLVLFMNNYFTVKKRLEEDGIRDKCIVIDAVSRSISPVIEGEGLFFADSLRNLTQIQIKILKIISSKNNFALICDSISVLNYYHGDDVVFKFVYSLTKLARKNSSAGFYINTDSQLSQKLGQFFDEQLTLKKYL
ncbi:MAG: hypothetical protein PHO61_01270 [Candidatus ainarchaeum sp.]|nr:hypothetical protein [Candidatus ainarchaeum sp.]